MVTNDSSDQRDFEVPRTSQANTPRLGDYLIILRKRKWIIIFSLVFILAISAYRTFSTKPTYVAACSLVLESQNQSASIMPGYYSYNPYRLETELQIISSRSISLGVVEYLNLAFDGSSESPNAARFISPFVESGFPAGTYHVVEQADGFRVERTSDGKLLGLGDYGEPFTTDDGLMGFTLENRQPEPGRVLTIETKDPMALAEGIRRSTEVRQSSEGNTFIVSVSSSDPEHAAELCNAVAEVYVNENLRWKQERARKAREFIGEQIEVAELKLRNTEELLREYKERTGIVTFSDEARQLTSLSLETERDQLDLAGSLARLYSIRDSAVYLLEGGELSVEELSQLCSWEGFSQNPLLMSLNREVGELIVERQRLLETTGPLNPRLEEIDNQLDLLNDDLRVYLSQAQRMGYLRSQIEGLEAQMGTVDSQRADLESRLSRLPKQEMELALRQRKADVASKIHSLLLEKYEEARINESMETGDVRILDHALVPNYPVSPNHTSDLLIGLAIGLVVGIGLAVVIELNDTTLKTVEEANRTLGINSIGVIPRPDTDEFQTDRFTPILVRHPRAPVAESYRILRTNIQYFSVDDQQQLITVTSPSKGDGKTTISVNLSIAFAQQGKKTLLVDTDLRKAQIHKYFGLPSTPGITELIIGDRELEETIRPSEVEDLYLLPAGHLPPNPSELLASRRVRELIERMRGEFDQIIFDTSPVLAVTDPAILGTQADGCILVFESEKTELEAAKEAINLLSKSRTRILGYVLNKVDLSRTYKTHHYYYYYYHRDEEDTTRKTLWQRLIGKK